jgi:hypothetical protein
MISQQDWLLSELLDFYKNREYLDILKKIVNHETMKITKNYK